MTAHTRYLPLSQEPDGVAPAYTLTPWLAARKTQVFTEFIVKNAGLLLVISAQFFGASMNLSVKLLEKLDPPTPTLVLITVRMGITVCCCMAYMVANRIPDPLLGPKCVRGLLVARGIAGFFALFGTYYALKYISLADATVVTFINPFTVAFAAHLLLGETYTKKEALSGVCGLLGVVLIARPTFLFGRTVEGGDDANITSLERLRAVGSALISVGGSTATYITMRAIGARAHPMHLMMSFSLCCVIVGFIAMAILREPMVFPMTWQWFTLLLIIGLLGVAGQITLTMGLRYETATRGSLGSYCQLLFAVVLELIVFGTVPSLLSTAGAAIIVAAQAYAVLSKQKLPDQPSVALSLISSDDVEEILLRSDSVDVSQNTELPSGKLDAEEEV